MASLIPGFEYDIFISYRQKDNKHDGWVTKFVEELKGELESTFKEEISVYFDINPSDYLLESYDVDDSLKEKLKCLIFIPIISRTYCDPKSFAWEHEFKAFIEQASKDQYGLKVKLPNGNVASRVLPVRIHDLDAADIKECESVLGGVLRGIEFIYHEPGVNRPLTANEESPHANLNRTIYRNQINKVALAVKEIISAVQNSIIKTDNVVEKVNQKSSKPHRNKPAYKRIITLSLLTLMSLVILLFAIIFVKNRKEKERVYSEIIPQINRLYESIRPEDISDENYWKAYHLLNTAEDLMPGDTNLAVLSGKITRTITILSEPSGASIYCKPYSVSDSSWYFFGVTPISNFKMPLSSLMLKIVKEGYQDHIDAFNLNFRFDYRVVFDTLLYKLVEKNNSLGEMTLIAGQKVKPNLVGISGWTQQVTGDFLIDKYEITNKAYMKFVEEGGYRNPVYWKHSFIKNERQLSWDEAMSYFKDQTGCFGPSIWSSGIFPSGKEQYPVSGISWYEAAAYAEFAGKNLPTLYHWSAITDRFLIPSQIRYSNISNDLVAPVGNFKGIGRHGVYDAIGNVREWIYNQVNKKYYIFGGGVKDPDYYCITAYLDDPWHRDEFTGFRCIKYIDESGRSQLERAFNYIPLDRSKDKPFSEEAFRLLMRRYDYSKTPVAVKNTLDKKFLEWDHKVITIESSYEGPDLEINIYFPNNTTPPFQSVIIFPGGDARDGPPTSIDNYPRRYDFLLRTGRAIVLPQYFYTYGRGEIHKNDLEYVNNCIKRVKDLRRAIDYMESRVDLFDTSKIAYFGISWGSTHAPWVLASEKRIKLGILNAFGLSGSVRIPELYHLNYLPHITIPMLMFSGKYDYDWSYESQKLFVQLLGTSESNKKWICDESVHGVSNNISQKEIIPWLDHYFGNVVNK